MSKKKPPKRTRFYSFLGAVVRPYFFLRYRLRFFGTENVPDAGAYILASNHISAVDPIILGEGLERQIMFMAKAELFEKKFLGRLLYKLGAFPVERGSAAAIDAVKHFEQVVRNGDLMCLFIEGTRSKTGEFLPPKNGVSLIAYDTGTPVIPVCITRSGRTRVVRFGTPLSLTDMGFEKGGAREFRSASRLIMDRIKALREQDFSD